MVIDSVVAAGDYTDPGVGSGHLIALGIAALLCYLYWRFDPKRRNTPPSPTGTAAPAPRETSQVARVSSHVSPTETPPAERGGHWSGRIVRDARGIGRRVYETAKHVAATGDSPPPADEVPDDVAPDDDEFGEEFDLGLDVDGEEPSGHEVPAPAEIEVRARRETREEYVARCLGEGVSKAGIVKALQEHYGLSRAQAYRLVPGDQRPSAAA